MPTRCSPLLFAAFVMPVLATAADAPAAPATRAQTLLTEPLPPLSGKEVIMLTIEVPPGGASAPQAAGPALGRQGLGRPPR